MAGGELHCRRFPAGGAGRAAVRPNRRRPFHHPRDAADPAARRASRPRDSPRMIKIALTGSIGMGKSTVAKMFEAAGVPVFDADSVVRQLQGPGGALVDRIGELFPGTVRCGTLDRDCLAQIVLEDPAKLAALEAVVHPVVRDWRDAFIDKNA